MRVSGPCGGGARRRKEGCNVSGLKAEGKVASNQNKLTHLAIPMNHELALPTLLIRRTPLTERPYLILPAPTNPRSRPTRIARARPTPEIPKMKLQCAFPILD